MRTHWFVSFLLVLGIGQVPALACTCAQPRDPQQGLAASDAVFRGYAERFELVTRPHVGDRKATFRVETVWKGPQRQRLEVFTAIDEGACGSDFIAGHTYLVYAKQREGALTTSICTRTVGSRQDPIQFRNDVEALGPGTAIKK